jgi:hypothetical protein
MQKWKDISFGMSNSAWKRSMTWGCSVVGMEPIPSAPAASMRFWQAGRTEFAPPGGSVKAKTTTGTCPMVSASSAAAR